ncbi:glycosyltransferase family 10 domain-containing protein [Pseudomonas sp. NFX5]|uniref:glycosyltransferase family 10 domain-containing protein n=1 Tax=Pseudomonas sp. NFX5 TaxID=2816961 RepID=UPI003B8D9535
MTMIYSAFAGNGLKNNAIFDLTNKSNRDDSFYPFYQMRKKFFEYGIEINTLDLSDITKIKFSLDFDVHPAYSSATRYLLMLETPQIRVENGRPENLDNYHKVFTWNDNLIDDKKFIKINFPNRIKSLQPDGFLSRPIFCCLISSNRALTIHDSRDLYKERVKAIRWFEKNAPENFHLYGGGWNIPAAKGGIRGAIERRFWNSFTKLVKFRPFPSYRGKICSKHETLKNTRFSICYENVRDLPGYITEKIFDCFFSGCIPIYWGASNISDYIPEDCFIDRRKFKDMPALYNYLENITNEEFTNYQRRIERFLDSDSATPFGTDFFTETIVKTIVKDLGL